MTRDETKALVEALHEIWNTGELDSIPDVYAEDVVVHWPRSSDPPDCRGHDGVRAAVDETRRAFPDWREDILDMIVDGDRVVTRYLSTGTHAGPYLGASASGARVEMGEISIYRIAAGKVAEQWCLFDGTALRRQLGV